MRALAKLQPTREGVSLVDVPVPEIGSGNDVLLRIDFSSISGSEVNIWRGTYRRPNGQPVEPGRILGYEHAGVVVEAGPQAQTLGYLPGRPVALSTPFIGCGKCEPCQEGFINRCRSWGHVGITLDGTNAEYACLPTDVLELLPPDVDPLDGAFLNSAGLAVRAVSRAGIEPGDRVAVFGPGPVGLLMVQAARLSGASWIGLVGLAQDAERLHLGQELGADLTYEWTDPVIDDLKARTDGLGPEVVLEAAGTPEAMSAAVRCVRVGGTVIFAGLPPTREASIEAIRVTRDEISIRGVEGSLAADRRRALRLMAAGRIRAVPLVTHRFPLEEADEAFLAAASGRACKAIFDLRAT